MRLVCCAAYGRKWHETAEVGRAEHVRSARDCVAKLFCPSKRVRLIQDQASMRNVDSRIHSLRFDCCIFLFYSLSAMTFATQSARSGHAPLPPSRVVDVA